MSRLVFTASGDAPSLCIRTDNGGELVDRVRLPANRVIAGVAPGGIVYMGVREEKGARLEQARRK